MKYMFAMLAENEDSCITWALGNGVITQKKSTKLDNRDTSGLSLIHRFHCLLCSKTLRIIFKLYSRFMPWFPYFANFAFMGNKLLKYRLQTQIFAFFNQKSYPLYQNNQLLRLFCQRILVIDILLSVMTSSQCSGYYARVLLNAYR